MNQGQHDYMRLHKDLTDVLQQKSARFTPTSPVRSELREATLSEKEFRTLKTYLSGNQWLLKAHEKWDRGKNLATKNSQFFEIIGRLCEIRNLHLMCSLKDLSTFQTAAAKELRHAQMGTSDVSPLSWPPAKLIQIKRYFPQQCLFISADFSFFKTRTFSRSIFDQPRGTSHNLSLSLQKREHSLLGQRHNSLLSSFFKKNNLYQKFEPALRRLLKLDFIFSQFSLFKPFPQKKFYLFMTRNVNTSSDIMKDWKFQGVTADFLKKKNALISFILALFRIFKV